MEFEKVWFGIDPQLRSHDLKSLLEAFDPPHFQFIPGIANSIVRLTARRPWLNALLQKLAPDPSVGPALSVLAKLSSSPDLQGARDKNPVAAAFCSDPDTRTDRLRSVALAGMLSDSNAPLPIMRRLAEAIFSAASKRGGAWIRVGLAQAGKDDSTSPQEFLTALAAALEKDTRENSQNLARDISNFWLPLFKGARVPEPPVGPPPPPPPPRVRSTGSPGQKTERRIATVYLDSSPVRVGERTVSFAKNLEDEPESETAAAVQLHEPSTTPADQPLPTLRGEYAAARRTNLGRNSDLLASHIDVLSDPEVEALRKELNRVVFGPKTPKPDRATCVAVLQFVLGRPANDFKRIQVLENLEGCKSDCLVIGLKEGIFRQPLIAPFDDHVAGTRRKTFSADVHESTALHLDLDLAPRVVEMLRKGFRSLAPTYLWAADEDPSVAIGGFLETLSLHPMTRFLGRFRRVLPTRLQGFFRDLESTMLILGETFGQPDSGLHYYSPKVRALQNKYVGIAWPLVGDVPIKKSTSSLDRLGVVNLVKERVAGSWVRSVVKSNTTEGPSLLDGLTRLDDIARFHNQFSAHTMELIKEISSHRPDMNRFNQLTRFDFDVVSHTAAISDKPVDVAHWTRFVTTTEKSSRQLRFHFSHLKALIALPQAPDALKQRAVGALAGTAPIFFFVDDTLLPLPSGKDNPITHPLPAGVASNWYRAYLSTYLREVEIGTASKRTLGAEKASAQLGHFASAGDVFCRDSVIAPIRLAAEIRPYLEAVERRLGWTTRSGLSAEESGPFEDLPPLKDWSADLERVAAELGDVSQAVEMKLRALTKANTKKGFAAAGQAISEVSPSLYAALIETTFGSRALPDQPSPSQAAPAPGLMTTTESERKLDPSSLEKIQLRIEEKCQSEIVAISARNALSRLLKHARTRLGWTTEVPGAWTPGRAPDPTPFFPGMMLARMQIHALRAAYMTLPKRAPLVLEHADAMCSRAALSIALFGFVNNVEELESVLSSRSFVRCGPVNDLVLVQIDVKRTVSISTSVRARGQSAAAPADPGQSPITEKAKEISQTKVFSLRGLAALSFLKYRAAHPDHKVPSTSSLGHEAVRQLSSSGGKDLPDLKAIVGEGHDFFERLCSTAAVNHRIEQSPAAREAYLPTGATSLEVIQQKALFEGDYPVQPSDGRRTATIKSDSADVQPGAGFVMCRRAYREMLGLLIQGPKEQEEAWKDRAIEKLVAIRDDTGPSVVKDLSRFALQLIKDGVDLLSTHTYVTSFAGSLIGLITDESQSLDLCDLSQDEFIELYEDIMLEKAENKSALVSLVQLMAFHKTLVKEYGVDEVHPSDLDVEIYAEPHQSDANVMPVEDHRKMMKELENSLAGGGRYSRPTDRVRVMASRVVYLVLKGSGARISEICGLRFKDFMFFEDCIALNIRPTPYRRLKTRAGSRLVVISTSDLTLEEMRLVRQWFDSEKSYSEKARLNSSDILSRWEDMKPARRIAMFREEIQGLYFSACGVWLKPHRLRHTKTCRALIPKFPVGIGELGAKAFQVLVDMDWTPASSDLMFDNRVLREVSHSLGHARVLTTLSYYFHFEWMLIQLDHALDRDHCGRWGLASSAGISERTADYRLMSEQGKTPRYVALTDLLPKKPIRGELLLGAHKPKPPAQKGLVARARPVDADLPPPRKLLAILSRVTAEQHVISALEQNGLHQAQAALIREEIRKLERNARYKLLESVGATPGIKVRRLTGSSDQALDKLWPKKLKRESVRFQQLKGLCMEFSRTSPVDRKNGLVLPLIEAQTLVELAQRAGLQCKLEGDGEDRRVNVLRPAKTGALFLNSQIHQYLAMGHVWFEVTARMAAGR